MKKTISIIAGFVLIASCSYGQRYPISIYAAGQTTVTHFKNAQQFGDGWYKSDRLFGGGGFALGAGMEFGTRFFVNAGYMRFSGEGEYMDIDETYGHEVKGQTIPIIGGVFARDRSKKFNIGAGLGVQYRDINLKQFTKSAAPTQLKDLRIRDAQLLYQLVMDFKISPNLAVEPAFNFGMTSGFSFAASLQLRYTFRKSSGD